jgi:hypothetical protein
MTIVACSVTVVGSSGAAASYAATTENAAEGKLYPAECLDSTLNVYVNPGVRLESVV